MGFNARLDAFLRKARENKHKKILIIFDNCESILQTDEGHINLPKDFLTLITRLTTYQECKIKIVITSAVDLRHILPPEINPFIVNVTKLSNNILSRIVYDRTSLSMDEANFKIAHGNPSAALLIAEMTKNGISLLDEMNQATSFAALVNRRMQLLSDEHQKLVELLSIIKYPMLVSEIQDLWKLLPPYSLISQSDITDLQQTFLIEEISQNTFLINPLVASVIEARIIDDLSKAIVCQKIEEKSIIGKFPLDYVRWPQMARNNVSRSIFPSIVENLDISYQFSIRDINKEIIANILQKHASDASLFLFSNIVTFFLFCGVELNDILFPSSNLIGVDFSQVHLFNTDLSNVNIINCQFADRTGSM